MFSIETKLSYNKLFFGEFISHRNEKIATFKISKILMYRFWYDYVKPKHWQKSKLYYMDTGTFIVYIKTNYTYSNIAKDAETRFSTSNYELDRSLPKRENRKGNWINERWIRHNNNDGVCCIKTENVELFNRW